jgi:signal transduction histidine kinase
MKLIDPSNGIRFGLFIFLFLILFCIVQLTWWIVYQLDLNRQIHQYRTELLAARAESISNRVNHDFQGLSELARRAYITAGKDRGELKKCMVNLLSDSAIVGYQISGMDSGKAEIGGVVDSSFYYEAEPGLTLYFNAEYPRRLIGTPPDLIFSPPAQNDGLDMIWVRADMFQIAPEVQDRIESESRKGLKMFVFEGSFFMLIVLSGAYMIYRTLQRSEDLKARQINFTRSVTHEFRTPLTSLRLYLETLDSGKLDTGQSQQLYRKMLDDCDRLDSMVDNVLETSHFGREKYELKLTEADLSRDLREYLDGLAPYIERQHGSLKIEIEENIRIRSDYHALGRAVRAVIDNALKYTPRDHREIKVDLSQAGKYAVLTIADQGVGIPHEEQDKIFERFYRITDNSRRAVKGTGLGLYLVRHIIEALGGKIEVKSEGADRGSAFIIRLPLVS